MENSIKILIVDDDKNFILSLSDGLISRNEKFDIITAENGKEAVKQLSKHEIDIVISDLKMPRMDGFNLLAYISNYYSKIPVIIITAFGTPDIEKELSNLGMFQLLEKPIELELLIQNINQAIEAKSNFKINHFSMFAFIQLIRIQKETCTLNIKYKDKEGFLYFKEGILMNAVVEKNYGEKEFFEILSWESPKIKVIRQCREQNKMIETSLETLLNKSKLKKERDMISEKQLESLGKVGGFLAAAVYTSDGQLVISKNSVESLDITMISAMAVELFKATRGITEGMQIGTPDTITVKTEKSIFIHNCIVTGAAGIGVVLTLDGNVGLAQLTLNQLVKEFKPYFS